MGLKSQWQEQAGLSHVESFCCLYSPVLMQSKGTNSLESGCSAQSTLFSAMDLSSVLFLSKNKVVFLACCNLEILLISN